MSVKLDIVAYEDHGLIRCIHYTTINGKRGRMVQGFRDGEWFDIGVPVRTKKSGQVESGLSGGL